MVELCGTTIDGKYEIVGTVGTGGFGTVYKAWQKQFDRMVAIKLLSTRMLEESDGLARFEREAKALATVQHKNIISFYGYGVWAQSPYMVMDFIEGTSLYAREIAQGKLEPLQAARIMKQTCEGLASAHTHGIVHRDLKPTNIMLEPGPDGRDLVKIIDFGLVKLMPGYGVNAQKLTEAGSTLGSSHYMSPEQCMGGDSDHRVDIYAAGCVLYEAVTGTLPFDADDPAEVMIQQIADTPRPISAFVPSSPVVDALQAVILKAMAKSADERYQTADEMVADLDLVIRGESGKLAQAGRSSNRKLVPPQSLRKTKRTARILIPVIAVALMVAAAVVLYRPAVAPKVEPTMQSGNAALGLYDDIAERVRSRPDDEPLNMIPVLEDTIAQNDKNKHLDLDQLSEIYRRLANARSQLREYSAALDAVEKAIQIRNPKERTDKHGWRYYIEKGNALWGLQKYDEASQTIHGMSKDLPQSSLSPHAQDYATLCLNRIYVARLEFDRADRLMTQALQRHDISENHRFEMMEELAMDRVYCGRFAGAQEVYVELQKDKHRAKRALLGLSRCAMYRRHFEEAQKYLEDLWAICTELERNQYDIWMLRIALACGLHDKSGAETLAHDLCVQPDLKPARQIINHFNQEQCYRIIEESGYPDLQQKLEARFGKI